jgi:putative DNA primase/helicase
MAANWRRGRSHRGASGEETEGRMNADDIDRVVEIERLAALDPIAYEVTRAESAKRLGVRASVLDRAVAKKRRELKLDNDQDDDGQGRAVRINDVLPWPDPVDGDQVASALAAGAKTYAVIPDAVADTIALWVLHTFLVNKFTVSPRLAVTSPTKGCGKTTILRFLNQVVRRPKRAGSISPSALFRVVEKYQPTVLLDETEKYIENGSDLHALLNEGHCKGGTVLRVLGDNLELREFLVFGPVAFARNGRLPDDLEQRSIIVEMQRRKRGEPLAELREDRCVDLQQITRMCSRWADDYGDGLDDIDPTMGDLLNRDADNWRSLFSLADLIGEDWPERIRSAATTLTPRESESTGPMLLADIKASYESKKTDRLWSEDLCEALAAIEGRPWAEWKAHKRAAAKPITKNQLAGQLKPFKVKPDSVWIADPSIKAGGRTRKGYLLDQFREAFERYLPDYPLYETEGRKEPTAAATSSAHETEGGDSTFHSVHSENLNNDGHPSGLPVCAGDRGLNDVNGMSYPLVCEHCGTPERTGKSIEMFVLDGTEYRMHRACRSEWLASPDPNGWTFNLEDGP